VLHSARRALKGNSLRVQILGKVYRENCTFCGVGRDAWIVLDCPQHPMAAGTGGTQINDGRFTHEVGRGKSHG